MSLSDWVMTVHRAQEPDAHEVRRALALLVDPEHYVQVQALPSGRWRHLPGGALDRIADAVAELGDEKGVYVSLNPFAGPLDHAVRTSDVVRRRWLLIDPDAVKPALEGTDCSTSDREKAAALAVTESIRGWLAGLGWPDPILVDSGNNWQLLYRVDLPADKASQTLLRECLKRLAERFDTAEVKVDRSVHDARRICKIPGTWVRKGSNATERPHRLSRLVSVPDRLDSVPVELLQALAAPTVFVHPVPDPWSMTVEVGGGDDGRAYARSALEREVGAVATSLAPGRNARLYEAAMKLGGLIAAGLLEEAEVRSQLHRAAVACGLGSDGDPGEIDRAIANGLGTGLQTPRKVPIKVHDATVAPTDWEAPILDESVPAEPFPLDVLPPELAFLVHETGRCLTCSVDFPAFTALAVAGGAIGRTLAIKVKESWAESPTIYGAIVARPGATKSSALSLMTRPLWILSEEYMATYKRDRERYEQALEQPDAVPGDAPVLARVVVNDTTCEALAPLLAENPHGLIMVRDELTAWVAGLNQYKSGGRGSDRQFFLSAWSGTPVTVDRKSQGDKGPIHIPHPFLCVVGSLTPDMLGELADEKGRDDGFLDRLLFAFPDEVHVRWNPDAVSEDSMDAWTRAVRQLHGREMTEDARGHPCPRFARMAPEALARYAAWFNDHEIESEQDDFPRHMVGVWSKLKAYCARFALILDQLHRVYDPTDDGSDVTIRLASVERAITLTGYFKNHCRRVRGLLRGATGENPDARAILSWILHGERAEFSERDVRRNFPGRFGGPESDLVQALGWMKSHHLIRPLAPPKPSGKAGRPPSLRYEVNPALRKGGGF